MTLRAFLYKAKTRMHRDIVIAARDKGYYLYLYKSYWHYKFCEVKKNEDCVQYLTSRPNPGAGIGHQLANWIAGYDMAKYYGLEYCTYPFSDLAHPMEPNEWDAFLGFNNGEIFVSELFDKGYKLILLPLIKFQNEQEREFLRNIISSYKGKKVIFLLEMDQMAGSELPYVELIQDKYWNAPAREMDKLLFVKDKFSVAVHVRRGDIIQTGEKKDDNLTMRWLDVQYYVEILDKYIEQYAGEKDYEIYVFSQSGAEELEKLQKYKNVKFCNHMNAIDSFLHMVNADMLVMSRSGMSYQAAKLNRKGIIIYPSGFWREPVEDERWLVE